MERICRIVVLAFENTYSEHRIEATAKDAQALAERLGVPHGVEDAIAALALSEKLGHASFAALLERFSTEHDQARVNALGAQGTASEL